MPEHVLPTHPLSTYVLEGRIVTMGPQGILQDGAIYVENGIIVDVIDAESESLPGFEDAPRIRTGDTIFPGLIELHNHLCFNAMPLWDVPKRFTNNGQWKTHDDYRVEITKPTQVLGGTPGVVEALVRYVECRALFGGVTTTQGVRLYTEPGITVFFKGLVRNVEEASIPGLPRAGSKIANPSRNSAEKYFNTLNKYSCYLQHISEGIDDTARGWFLNLQFENGEWAINERFCGIHATAFEEEDFQIVQERGASIVWSPLSNFLLYGDTMDIEAAKRTGVLLGIGSDWAPSGSKNLIGEMKIAWLVSQQRGGVFSAEDIVRMATINGAKILKWDDALGSIEKGKKADFMALNGRKEDPFVQMIDARETSITLVIIDGVPRIGQKSLMRKFDLDIDDLEQIKIGSSSRYLNLHQEETHPLVGTLSFTESDRRLKDAMARLPQLASDYDIQSAAGLFSGSVDSQGNRWRMVHDFEEDDLPFEDAAKPMSYYVTSPQELEGITVPDDRDYFKKLYAARNLPEYIKKGLPPLYGERVPRSDAAITLETKQVQIPEHSLDTVRELRTFLKTWGELKPDQLEEIVDQALLLLEENYVHLPFKKARHAIDPVQRLRLLRHKLEERNETDLYPEIQFHNEIARIFNSLRDLHTTYRLPHPFKYKVAWLPFMIESYWEKSIQKYMVSKVIGDIGPSDFKPGIEILYWNGTPIKRVVDTFADQQAGGNGPAREAQAVNGLTIRPLSHGLPPDEEWVTLTYRDEQGALKTIDQEWLVIELTSSVLNVNPEAAIEQALPPKATQTALGLDPRTDEIQNAKRTLYAGQFANQELETIVIDEQGEVSGFKRAVQNTKGGLETYFPTIFRPKPIQTPHGQFGYIRIFTFNVSSAEVFVAEFVRLVKQLPQEGLIIDVRGNGGGLIPAAEMLLQVLSPKRITPQKVQFINTAHTLALCEAHSPSPTFQELDLSPWVDSIKESIETGATYSNGYPITKLEDMSHLSQVYYGPILLITDALCYSATDIFAAGFQDHQVGSILGTSSTTGAGGANVWSHSILSRLTSRVNDEPSKYKSLPHGADLRVAMRRTLRTGLHAGQILEDLGVRPDQGVHQMTRDDLLNGNVDLLEHATGILANKKSFPIEAELVRSPNDHVELEIRTKHISRIDFCAQDRIWRSYNVDSPSFTIQLSDIFDTTPEVPFFDLMGYAEGQLVSTCRIPT